ncbi:MAG: hypothetical protein MJZ36_11245 [Bacteroidaceae bacterium]|nr:hypothetical protein [Bacteroidaceae bacterium]
MKKDYFSSLKIALFAVLSLVCLSANAGESSNLWYYVAAKAYPSGSGTVYVTNTETDDPETHEYKDYSEAFYHDNTGIYNGFNFYAQPAEGKKFVGWATVDTDENGNEVISDIIDNDNPSRYYITAKTDTGEDDYSTGDEPWPLLPDTTFAAVFGYIDYKYIPGQGGYAPLGKVSIKNPAAEIGEEITFTATPKDSTCTFVKWIDANGKEYNANPLTLKVEGPNTLIPYFKCTNSQEFSFPEDGALMITVSEREFYIGDAYDSGVAKAFSFYDECWQKDSTGVRLNNYVTNNPSDDGYQYQRRRYEGFILWGKGNFNVQLDDYENCLADTATYCRYDYCGFKVEDVLAEGGMKCYVLAGDHKFHQVTEGFVDETRWALCVPDSVGETSPVLDFVLEAAGETVEKRFPILNPFDLKEFKLVEDPSAISNLSAEEPKTLQQIFDLGGRLVATPRKGVMIKDGKKVMIK